MKMLLIRHGKIAGDPYIKPQRPVHGCLSPLGIQQAQALGRYLEDRPIDLAICSSYGRALQTAEIALHGRDVPFRILDAIKEWLPDRSLKELPSTQYESILSFNNNRHVESTWKTELGEGVYDMYARIIPPLLELWQEYGITSQHGGYILDPKVEDKTFAIFAHGGSLNVVLSFLLKIPPFPLGGFGFQLTGLAEINFIEKAGIHYPVLVISAPYSENPEAGELPAYRAIESTA